MMYLVRVDVLGFVLVDALGVVLVDAVEDFGFVLAGFVVVVIKVPVVVYGEAQI